MSTAASNLVNKVWNYCNLLRDDGVSYGDYVEQLTYLLFLKMDYERTRPPYNKKSIIPEDYNWASLIEMDGLPLGLCPELRVGPLRQWQMKVLHVFFSHLQYAHE